MDRTELICIGHITHDKVVTPRQVVHMAGGTAFYFSNAVSNLDIRYKLFTALAPAEMPSVYELQAKGIDTIVLPSAHTVFFENIYSGNQDHRTQRVVRQADPFTSAQFAGVEAGFFHLGPLLAGDIPLELIQALAQKGKVALDAQGYLREVKNQDVLAIDWADKMEGLKHIHTLKVNEYEMAVLTGEDDVRASARTLAAWGVKEVVITLGSFGSVIYDGEHFFTIPAYVPTTSVVDATGCGDTYMAGYLYKRIKGASIQEAGEFAAAMATLKIEGCGPFTGTEEDVLSLLSSRKDKGLPMTPAEITDKMMEKDAFSRWMGLEVDESGPGFCKLHYRINSQMLNGFGIVHGGIIFSAADSAFAFACNSHGMPPITVALDVSISFTRPAREGDLLVVEARELHLGNRTGLYDIRTTNEAGELIAHFKGTAYRTSKEVK